MQYIGDWAFYNNGIETLTFEENSTLKSLGDSAFEHNELTSVEIPSSVQTISNQAFLGNFLTKVTFKLDDNGNSNLTTIGINAFNGAGLSVNGGEYHNNNLTYPLGSPLFIPSSVTYVGEDAFNSNSNLKEIKYSGDYSSFGTDWKPYDTIVTK